MRLELRPSERSTPDRPLWVWHLWHRGQLIAFGFAPSREEAEEQAEAAFARHERARERFGWPAPGQLLTWKPDDEGGSSHATDESRP